MSGLTRATIFNNTARNFTELSQDRDLAGYESNIPSIRQSALSALLRLSPMILPEDSENVSPDENDQYEKIFKFMLFNCLVNHAATNNITDNRGDPIRRFYVGNTPDEVNHAYTVYLNRIQRNTAATSPRNSAVVRRRTSSSTSRQPLQQRRRLTIDTQLANLNQQNNVVNQRTLEASSSASAQSSSMIRTLTDQISSMIDDLPSVSDSIEQMRSSLEQTISSGRFRPPTPIPPRLISPPVHPYPSPRSLLRIRRRQSNMRLPTISGITSSPSGSRTETDSVATEATEIVPRSPSSPIVPAQRIQRIQRIERLTFNQLLDRITLHNPNTEEDRSEIIHLIDQLHRLLPPTNSSQITTEDRRHILSGVSPLWAFNNDKHSHEIQEIIRILKEKLLVIVNSYILFSQIIENITNQRPVHIESIEHWVPSLFLRQIINNYIIPPDANTFTSRVRVPMEVQRSLVLTNILNRPIRIHHGYSNVQNVERYKKDILDLSGIHRSTTDTFCDTYTDLITLDTIEGDDIIYIQGPSGKACYERKSFLHALESTVWVTLLKYHFVETVKIISRIFGLQDDAFTYSETAQKLDRLMKKIIQKKYENIDNGINKTVFYPEVLKNVFDVYRLFKDPLNQWMPHEALLMVKLNPYIKNFKMVEMVNDSEFYSVQIMWSGVSVVHETKLYMLYPLDYNQQYLRKEDLNCNGNRYFHPISDDSGMNRFVTTNFRHHFRANP